MPNHHFIELTIADPNVPVLISTDSIAYVVGDSKNINYSTVYFKNATPAITVNKSFKELKELLGI